MLVNIDIRPGSYPNCGNLNEHGVIPVAIFGSTNIDVYQIDTSTVELEGMAVRAKGKSNKLLAHYEDGDSITDLVVQIEDSDGSMTEGQTLATGTGNLLP